MGVLRKITTLFGFKVDRGSAARAEAAIDQIKGSLSRVDNIAANIGRELRSSLLGFVSVAGLAAGARGIGGILLQSDNLQARLETIEGSAEGAARSMARLSEFAKNTPFQINNLTDAFVGLRVSGFEASDQGLTALGDTAAAFGKDITEIADAAKSLKRGEADPIEQFGISAKFSGDRVSLAFGDMKRTVKRDTAEIERFLIDVGEANFAGAMARQMDTIGGRVSNLRDAVFRLVDKGIGGSASDPNSLRSAINGLLDELLGVGASADGAARSLGYVLARGVRALTRAIRYLRDNAEQVQRVLELVVLTVGARAALQGFAAFATGLRAIGTAGALAQAKLLLIPAALLGIVLILQDLLVFLRGDGKSVIGDLLGSDGGGVRESLQRIVDAFTEVGDEIRNTAILIFGELQIVLGELGIEIETVGELVVTLIVGFAKLAAAGLRLGQYLIRITRPFRILAARVLVNLYGKLRRIVAVFGRMYDAFAQADPKTKTLIKALAAVVAPIAVLIKGIEYLGELLGDDPDLIWIEALSAGIAPLLTLLDGTIAAVEYLQNLTGSGPGTSITAAADMYKQRKAAAFRDRTSDLRDAMSASSEGFDRESVADSRLIGGAGRGMSIVVSDVSVNVDGSLDMSSDEFEKATGAAAQRALDKAVLGAFEDFDEVQ